MTIAPMVPYQNLIHTTGHTYGMWLRGDPRGWRSRKGREHVNGDYKNPPPEGLYEAVFEQSRRLMQYPGVTLTRAARKRACEVMVEALRFH